MVVPAETPVTSPEMVPMVATLVRLLLHLPPEMLSDNEIGEPVHTPPAPLIKDGIAFTVACKRAAHPVLI